MTGTDRFTELWCHPPSLSQILLNSNKLYIFHFFQRVEKMLSLAFDIRASQAPIRSYSFFLWALKNIFWAAAIARWLHLNLPTAVSNPKHTIKAFFQYVLLKLF